MTIGIVRRWALNALSIGLAATALLSVGVCQAGDWTNSLPAAVATAKRLDLPILADFTGSDWCPWCIKLRKEVFDTPEFRAWAPNNVVLLELDFPQTIAQPAPLKKQNKDLAGRFQITGYPTVIFMDAEGNKLGQTGFIEGGATNWIKNAERILPPRPKVEPLTSLAQAKAKATQDHKAMLVVLADKNTGGQADAMLANPVFVKYAAIRLVVVKPAEAADEQDKAALAELLKSAGGSASSFRVLAWDPAADKTVFKAAGSIDLAVLAIDLEKVLPPLAYDGGWLDDYFRAQVVSAGHKKPMLVNFTSADAPSAGKLETEILANEQFTSFAKDKLVLVKLDVSKSAKPGQTTNPNGALARKLGVESFPTILILTAQEQKLGQLGYLPGGPDAFVAKLKQFVSKPDPVAPVVAKPPASRPDVAATPQPATADRAVDQLKLAQLYIDSGLKDRAKETLQAIVKDFPDTESAKAAKGKLTELGG
jgi:protein disulfide-isomerase